jgi:hypothetical protein
MSENMSGNMGFRIRSESSNNAYLNHLEKYDKSNHTDLWRFFYWDFFHDGIINEISFQNGADEVIIDITCPNIKRKTGINDFEYVNVDFHCEFSDVVYLNFEKHKEKEENENDDSGALSFLSSEINSLSERIGDAEEYQSLIIEVMHSNGPGNSSYVEIVFRDVIVEAIESTAFELMLASRDFEVPIYTEKG